MTELTTSRRGVLTAAFYGILGSIGSSVGIPAVRYLFSPPRSTGESEWADAGDVSGLAAGAPRELTFRRLRRDAWKLFSETAGAWIVKSPAGQITAFSPMCTHLGCAYRWEGRRNEFVCPCHGSRFGVDGRVLEGPAPRDLDRYLVKIEGQRLWLGPVRPSQEIES